jgi:hypothetical protein
VRFSMSPWLRFSATRSSRSFRPIFMIPRTSVELIESVVKGGNPALALLQNIKFPTANTAKASRIPAATAIRSQFRKRGRDLGRPSMCADRSDRGKECNGN